MRIINSFDWQDLRDCSQTSSQHVVSAVTQRAIINIASAVCYTNELAAGVHSAYTL
jgi:hypothetical protein